MRYKSLITAGGAIGHKGLVLHEYSGTSQRYLDLTVLAAVLR
jgi:hypothetical protein